MKPLLIDHYQSLGLENFIESRKRTLPSCQEMSLPVPLGGPQPLPLAAHVPLGRPTAPPPSPFLLSLKVDSPLHPNSSSFLPYLSLLLLPPQPLPTQSPLLTRRQDNAHSTYVSTGMNIP